MDPWGGRPPVPEGPSVKKILLVEGPQPIDGLSSALFRRRECVLQVASSGTEALSIAEGDRPDLVMYDARLKDFSPEDFVQALNSAETEIPVIIVADLDAVLREGAILRGGASAVLFRPLDPLPHHMNDLRRGVHTAPSPHAAPGR